MSIPRGIERAHVLQAVEDFRGGVAHDFGPSTGYDLVLGEERYPPKAIVGLAARRAVGADLHPRDFSGGEESRCFRLLRQLGFDVEPKPAQQWDLAPGERIKRTELHARFGGRRQGGVSPSNASPNVMVFTAPSSGEQWGYVDEWVDADVFHYTGEGQRGDMQLVQGNRAILNHVEDGRALRLFEGARGTVTYVGELVIDELDPYHRAEASEKGSDTVREVVVFHMRRATASREQRRKPDKASAAIKPVVASIAPESTETESFTQTLREGTREADRRESRLVARYRTHVEAQGGQLVRQRIDPPGERSLYTDLFAPDRNLLIEAKGSVTRESIRLAIGQLLDYQRFFDPRPDLAMLLPSKPRPDLVELLGALGIVIIFPSEQGFEELLVGADSSSARD